MKCRLTYFTPTYNRENLLGKLYESLKNQTNKCFVWLVIDDGSTDNTKELIKDWQSEDVINIKYVYKENGGKNTAIDLSNQICETEFIACIDSDDYLTEDCTEILYNYFQLCTADDKNAGIVGKKGYFDGTPFNNSWTESSKKICFYDIAKFYNYTEDTFLIFKTDVIKNYKFPKIQDEKFITEAVLYQQFLYDNHLLMIPECLYLAEYQDDGYSYQGIKLFFKNPKGYLYYLKQNIYIARKRKMGLLKTFNRVALFYAWKNLLKLNDKFNNEYKIPVFHRIIGAFLQIVWLIKLKKQYKEFKNDKNR